MLARKAVEDILARVRVLRVAGDAGALADLLHDDATLRIVGFGEPATGKNAVLVALRRLIDTFEFLEYRNVETFVDGNSAAMRYGLKLRHGQSGAIAETEAFDLITIEDGKILSYIQHADTALIERLLRG